MNITQLNNELRQQAINLSACQKGLADWRDDKSLIGLIQLFKRNSQFCLYKGYPSSDMVFDNFNRTLLRLHGVFVDDDNINEQIDNGTYVFRNSTANLDIKQFQAVAVKTSASTLDIHVSSFASLTLSIYNGGKYTVNTDVAARAVVFDYSDGMADIIANDKVKIFRKKLTL
jgi:hypothetical protein